jgi:hypothetical protein
MIAIHAEGAAREAIVKADLLRRGFDVFGAEAGNTSFDIVAHKYGFLLRIEVKGDGSKVNHTSPIACTPSKRNTGTPDCRKFDVLAAVKGTSVRYLRSILHEFNAASKELVGEEVESKMTSKKVLERRKSMVQ